MQWPEVLFVISNLAAAAFAFWWWQYGSETQRSLKPKGVYIKQLYIYPVKSCAGIGVPSATIGRFGLQYDRTFMVVRKEPDEQGIHEFVTQRQYPKMALIQPAFRWGPSMTKPWMCLQAPACPTIRISTDLSTDTQATKEPIVRVRVWNDVVQAECVGEEADQWLTQFLGTELRLVRVVPFEHKRPLNAKYVPAEMDHEAEPAFADAFPFLLASWSSLHDLNAKRLLQAQDKDLPPIQILQFRPNILVCGDELKPWVEDRWSRVAIGEEDNNIVLYGVKACSRCTVPNVIPSSGERPASLPVTKLLRTHRTRGNEKEVFFGTNLVHLKASIGKEIHVGDCVSVLDIGKPVYEA
eukprot:gb/GEZN01010919.1/.p1 GENE.gb/GEZN01010919.1/~~gb/GEZN01010919.1/.p1  ORF type:complete len:353 (+),score=30.80 gb/GEZN01010919.1/:25-1083(+)